MKTKILLFFLAITSITYSQTNPIEFISSGALQSTSIRINARLNIESNNVKAIIAKDSLLSIDPFFTNTDTSNFGVNHGIVHFFASNLNPNTKYYYRISINDSIIDAPNNLGTFTTPDTGAFNFRMAFASCNQNNFLPVYSKILNENILYFFQGGDWHYKNINSANINDYYNAFDSSVYLSNDVKKILQNVPFNYTWDDHDYCGNDLGGSFQIGSNNVKETYRLYNPHYPLPADQTNKAIYHAYTIGRIRFIVSDARSCRTDSSLLGIEQKIWFKNELLNCKNQNLFPVWVSSVSFYGDLSDNWGGFAWERKELCDFFSENKIKQMLILSGDAHMLAIDDGSNGDFSTNHDNPYKYPVVQAAALNAWGSYKGGTYSEGYFPNPSSNYGQYSVINFDDNGQEICIDVIGRRVNFLNEQLSTILTYSFCRNEFTATKEAQVSDNLFYPNPSSNLIFSNSFNENGFVNVYDLFGKKIMSKQIKNPSLGIDISTLEQGFYIFEYNGRKEKILIFN